MKVRVITELAIWDYCKKNARAKPSFYIFLEKLKDCDWNNINEIMADFHSAGLAEDCENDRIIFDIGGNKYRMICSYNFYKHCCLYVAFIGTHAQYDKVNACTVQMY